MQLVTHKNIVQLPSGEIKLHLPVLEAVLIGERMLVIHDYMAYPQDKPAQNLVAYSMKGEILWVAENPTLAPTDAYVNFVSEQPLQVGNFAGYQCTIVVESGKVQSSVFTK